MASMIATTVALMSGGGVDSGSAAATAACTVAPMSGVAAGVASVLFPAQATASNNAGARTSRLRNFGAGITISILTQNTGKRTTRQSIGDDCKTLVIPAKAGIQEK